MNDEAEPSSRPKHHRRVRNFLLQPFLQVQLSVYTIFLTFFFTILLMAVVYVSFERIYDLILDLTDLRDEVSEILSQYLFETAGWLCGVILLYLFFNIIVTIVYTHRLVGPTIAFRKHIADLRQGNYSSRITLRKSDAFAEVANELNALAESLEKSSGARKD